MGAERDEGLIPGDPMAEMLRSQIAAGIGAERPWAIAELPGRTGKFRFRSKPGYRGLSFTIPVPLDTLGMDKDRAEHEKKVYDRRYPKDGSVKPNVDLKRLTAMMLRHGSRLVRFENVPQKFECWFDTDDEEMAAWLRSRKGFGDRFYEEVGPITLTLADGETVDVVPKTAADRAKLARAAAG